MKIKRQVYSSPYNIVFEKKYPSLFIGAGIFYNKEKVLENNPKNWILKEKTEVENIRKQQSFLYKEHFKNDAQNPEKDILQIQELTKSYKDTELEVDILDKRTVLKEKITGIYNNAQLLEKIKITENIKVLKPIEKITNDFHLKAKDGILEFYKKTKDIYKLEQILSMGLLGLKKNRLFLPTRWSITCIDDTLGKSFFENIKTNKIIDAYKMKMYKYYDNIFYIFYLPFSWGFEMIEFKNNKVIAQDYELNLPKKDYAYNVTGAYYSARLPVLEEMQKNNFCARILLLRDIKNEYTSKGVWVIRESIIKAIMEKEVIFNNIEEVINFIKNELKINWILEKSEILRQIKFQKRIFDF
jgi:DNA repair protein NreA